jgi:hypothetical protein
MSFDRDREELRATYLEGTLSIFRIQVRSLRNTFGLSKAEVVELAERICDEALVQEVLES